MPTPNLFGFTSASTKVLRLAWSGGVINAEPSGWKDAGFDDSGWETPVAPIPDPNGGWVAPIPPGEQIVPTDAHDGVTLNELTWLARLTFDLATVGTDLEIYAAVDNVVTIFVNGVQVYAGPGDGWISGIGADDLVVGENVVAFRVFNTSGTNTWTHNPTFLEAQVWGDGTLGTPVEPPPPEPEIIVEIEPVTLDNLVDRYMRVEHNGPGSFKIAIGRHDEQATTATFTRGRIVRMTFTEIDPDPIGEFLLDTGDFKLLSFDEEGGEILDFGGPGSLVLLKKARLWHESVLGIDDQPVLEERVWRFTTLNAAGNIIRRLLLEAQARTPAVIPEVGETFGQFVDTNGATWDEIPSEWEGRIGSDLLTETLKFAQQGQFEVRMDPGFIFNAYQPGTMGRDLTGTAFGAGVVRFVKGVNIATELTRGMQGREWYSRVLAEKRSGFVVVDHPSPPYTDVREGYLDLTQYDDDDSAEKAAVRRMLYGDEQQEQLTFEIPTPLRGTPVDDDNGIYLPGPPWSENGRFWVGDQVTVHTGTGELDYNNQTFRVAAISIYGDPEDGNQIRCIVELNSPYTPPDGTLPTTLSASGESAPGGGSTGGGTGGGTLVPGIHRLPAARVDVTDTAGNFTGTDVEAVLAELAAATGGTDLGWFNVRDYGAVGDGSTDDTAAIQAAIDACAAAKGGTIYFPAGEYVISGALQDTGARNAQLLLPNVDPADPQITLTFRGAVRAPMHPIGSSPDQTYAYSILRSTLTGASGTAAVISGGNGSFLTGDENNIQVNVYDLTCLSPDDPSMTWWNIEMTQGGERSALLISVDTWTTASQPTHSNAYGIKLPALGNSNASIAWGDIMVGGHYTGIKQGELCDGVYVTGLCYIGVELPAVSHPSAIRSLQQTLCTYGVKVTGEHQCDIGLHAMERNTSPAWAEIIYDIDDPSNLWRGHVRWASITGAAVYDHVYLVNGGSGVSHEEIGELPSAVPSGAAGGDLSGTYPNPTVVNDGHTHTAATVTGVGSEILISDTPSTPLVFADLIQNEAQNDLVYSD